MFLCIFLLIYKLVTSAKLNKSYHYVVQPTFSLKGFIFVSIRTKTACGIKCGSGHQTENGKAPKLVLYHHYVAHWRAFCELKWRYWHFSPLGYSRDCSDCFLVIFFSFYCVDAFQSDGNSNTGYDLGHKHVLGPTQSWLGLKRTLSWAQTLLFYCNPWLRSNIFASYPHFSILKRCHKVIHS